MNVALVRGIMLLKKGKTEDPNTIEEIVGNVSEKELDPSKEFVTVLDVNKESGNTGISAGDKLEGNENDEDNSPKDTKTGATDSELNKEGRDKRLVKTGGTDKLSNVSKEIDGLDNNDKETESRPVSNPNEKFINPLDIKNGEIEDNGKNNADAIDGIERE